MKITKAQRRNALSHDDRLVRDEILRISYALGDTGLEITRICQDTIDRLGMLKAYSFSFQFKSFTLDPETAAWVLRQIQKRDNSHHATNWKANFAQWLQLKAPPEFAQEHRDVIIRTLAEAIPTSRDELAETFDKAIAIRTLTPSVAFQQLQEHCAKGAEDEQFAYDEWSTTQSLIAQLRGGDETIKKTVLDFLQSNTLEEKVPSKTDHLYETYLNAVGPLQIEVAVPILLESMLIDRESINEDIPEALAKIKTSGTIEKVATFYQKHLNSVGKDDYNYLTSYLSDVFERIDLDLAGEKAGELLTLDPQEFSQATLARAAAARLDDDLLPSALAFWKGHREFSEADSLVSTLYTHAILTGQHPSDIPHWRSQLLAEQRRHEEISKGNLIPNFGNGPLDFGSTPAKPTPPKPERERTYWEKPEVTTGRNDPCPCGSGKKFKKCCMA